MFTHATPQHKAPVDVKYLVATGLGAEEVTVLQRMVLVDESMIRRDHDVAGIGVGQLFDHSQQLFQCFLCSAEHTLFGIPRISRLVDQIVINVHHIVIAHQGA